MAKGRSEQSNGKAAFVLPFLLLAASMPERAEAATETLQPLSPWLVERHAESCALSAAFGSEKAPLTLHFERFQPFHDFQLMLIGKRMNGLKPPTPIGIQYGIGGKTHTTKTYRSARTAGGTSVILIPFSAIPHDGETEEAVAASEASVTELILHLPDDKHLAVETASLAEPFAAFRTCTDELVRSWGFDAGHQKRLSRKLRPATDPRTWLRSSDYPKAALANLAQARVNFRLEIDSRGIPTKCAVQRSIGRQFDMMTCSLLKERARFEPALNKDGTAVPSFYISTAYWLLP